MFYNLKKVPKFCCAALKLILYVFKLIEIAVKLFEIESFHMYLFDTYKYYCQYGNIIAVCHFYTLLFPKEKYHSNPIFCVFVLKGINCFCGGAIYRNASSRVCPQY